MIVTDIITGIYQYGIAPTAALICTSLYIFHMIDAKTRDRANDSNEKTVLERYNRELDLLSKILDHQGTIIDQNKLLTLSMLNITDITKTITTHNAEQLALTNTLITDVKILANNQLTMTSGLQKVIEQLIAALRD